VSADLGKRLDYVEGRCQEAADMEVRLLNLEESGGQQDNTQQLDVDGQAAQMGEILNLTQIITAGTEKLAERIASETAMWRSSKLQSEARFNYIEKIIGGLSGDSVNPSEPDVPASEPELPPLMSEDLKDTLETLVSKLNRTLKPEAQVTLGGGQSPQMASFAQMTSHAGVRADSTTRDRSTSRGPYAAGGLQRSTSPAARHDARTMSTDTGLRQPYVRGTPAYMPGSSGVQRSVSLHGAVNNAPASGGGSQRNAGVDPTRSLGSQSTQPSLDGELGERQGSTLLPAAGSTPRKLDGNLNYQLRPLGSQQSTSTPSSATASTSGPKGVNQSPAAGSGVRLAQQQVPQQSSRQPPGQGGIGRR